MTEQEIIEHDIYRYMKEKLTGTGAVEWQFQIVWPKHD